jgi:hypothetical protein
LVLEYGMVGPQYGLVSTEVAPFAGIQESEIGREAHVTAFSNTRR